MGTFVRNLTSFSQSEVLALFKEARLCIRAYGLKVLVAPAHKEFGRILIVTPKKSGNSPERHRIKRRLREIFYKEKIFDRKKDYIVLVSKDGIETSSKKLQQLFTLACSTNDETSPSPAPKNT